MRARDFLIELADSPAKFTVACNDDDVCEVLSPELGLALYLTRGMSHELKNNMVFILNFQNSSHR